MQGLRVVATLLCVILAALVFSFSSNGYAWMDEVCYADPAARLAGGKGFTSAAWWHQSDAEFWAANTPLPALALAVPYYFFGVTFDTGRIFWLTNYTLSVVILLSSLIGLGTLRSVSLTVFASFALMVSPAAWHAAAIGRPDALGVLLCTLLFAITCRNPTSSWLGPVAAGVVWSGPQFWVFAPLVVALCLPLVPPPHRLRLVFNLGSGATAGGFALGTLYFATDSHMAFLHSTFVSNHNSLGQLARDSGQLTSAILTKGFEVLIAPTKDPWTFMLGVGPLTWMLVSKVSGKPLTLQAYACLFCVSIPMVMCAAGKYPPYYHWMALFPTVVAALASWQLLVDGKSRVAFLGLKILWIASGATALLSTLTYGTLSRKDRPEKDLTNQIPSSEAILADFTVYFDLFGRHPNVFTPSFGGGRLLPHLPKEASASVRWAILSPDNLVSLAKWEGNWHERGRIRIFVPSLLNAITKGAAGQSMSLDTELVLLEKLPLSSTPAGDTAADL